MMTRGWDGGWLAMGNFGTYIHIFLTLVTWILIIAILVAVLRWLWKKGGK